jgi:hypothetical protein
MPELPKLGEDMAIAVLTLSQPAANLNATEKALL